MTSFLYLLFVTTDTKVYTKSKVKVKVLKIMTSCFCRNFSVFPALVCFPRCYFGAPHDTTSRFCATPALASRPNHNRHAACITLKL